MIKFKTAAFIATNSEAQTPQKVSRGVVLFHTPEKGVIQTWVRLEKQTKEAVFDELQNEVEKPQYGEVENAFHKNHKLDYFTGKKADILKTATAEYAKIIGELNPNVELIIE